jgi:hypothetical protein
MDFLFHFQLLIGVIAGPKSLSSAETDLVQSTTVQQLWAGVTTTKADFRHFLNSSKLQPRVSRSCRHTQVMLQTVTLFYIHCGSVLACLLLSFHSYHALPIIFRILTTILTTDRDETQIVYGQGVSSHLQGVSSHLGQ